MLRARSPRPRRGVDAGRVQVLKRIGSAHGHDARKTRGHHYRWPPAIAHDERPLCAAEIGSSDVKSGSAAPVRAHDEQSFGCRVTPIGVESRRPAASEVSSRNADARRCRLSRQNGRSTRKPRRTAMGRSRPFDRSFTCLDCGRSKANPSDNRWDETSTAFVRVTLWVTHRRKRPKNRGSMRATGRSSSDPSHQFKNKDVSEHPTRPNAQRVANRRVTLTCNRLRLSQPARAWRRREATRTRARPEAFRRERDGSGSETAGDGEVCKGHAVAPRRGARSPATNAAERDAGRCRQPAP